MEFILGFLAGFFVASWISTVELRKTNAVIRGIVESLNSGLPRDGGPK